MEQIDMHEHLDKHENKEEMFAYIFENYSKRIYNYIYYRINCQYTAEDLMSIVFEKVMLKIDSYSEKKASFEVWLFAIARNVLNDYFRRLKRHKVLSLDSIKDLISKQPTPEDKALSKEAHAELFKCLEVLSNKERNIIALKFGANLKNVEIATLLDTSSSNVGVLLFRIINKLKLQMEKEGYMHE